MATGKSLMLLHRIISNVAGTSFATANGTSTEPRALRTRAPSKATCTWAPAYLVASGKTGDIVLYCPALLKLGFTPSILGLVYYDDTSAPGNPGDRPADQDGSGHRRDHQHRNR